MSRMQEGLTKDIITGSAIVLSLCISAIYLPVIGFFSALLIPLPVLFYRLKLGRNNGAIIPAAAVGIAMILSGSGIFPQLFFFAGLALLGFSMAETAEKKHSIDRIILYSIGIVTVTGIFGLLFYSNIVNTQVYELISNSEYVTEKLDTMMQLFADMGMPPENAAGLYDVVKATLIQLLPAQILTNMLIVSWLNLLIARSILVGRNLYPLDLGRLKLWRAPEHFIWGIIGCGAALMLPLHSLKIIALNGLIILLTVYFFQGIAIAFFFFEKKNFPMALRVVIVTIIAMQPLLWLVIVTAGIFDIWLNFRKPRVNENN